MPFKFEELRVWHRSVELANEVDVLAKNFPREERFSLANQIKRAGDSVVLNIAEGSTGRSNAEFKRFLDIALGSGVEVVACLFLAKTRKYISEEHFKKLYDDYDVLCRMITKLRDSLQ